MEAIGLKKKGVIVQTQEGEKQITVISELQSNFVYTQRLSRKGW